MNIYVHGKGIILTGKAWEVRQKLKEYGKRYEFVADWMRLEPNSIPPPSNVASHKQHLIMSRKEK
jgi:hypothetical protein